MHTDLIDTTINFRLNESVVVTPALAVEQRVVTGLIRHLRVANFSVVRAFDGDSLLACATAKNAVDIIFDARSEETSLYFKHVDGGVEHEVMLVLGNGLNMVTDWNCSHGDKDGFGKAMHVFDANTGE